MTRFANTALAACAALFITMGSIGAIVAVPTTEAAAHPVVALPSLA